MSVIDREHRGDSDLGYRFTTRSLGHTRNLLALVESGLFAEYFSYERDGVRWFAADTKATVRLTATEVRWTVDGRDYREPLGRRPLRQLGDVLGDLLPPTRRAYGYIAFDAARLIHALDRPAPEKVLAHFMIPGTEIVWRGSTVSVESENQASAAAVTHLVRDLPVIDDQAASRIELDDRAARSRYEAMVDKVVASIEAGELRKAILSRRVEVPFPVDLARSYVKGLTVNTPARSFLFDLGEIGCAGFSPEILLRVSADGLASTQPLAGTRPLRVPPDAAVREELEWDVKECYEHVISVRLAVQELATVCSPGTVAVRDLLDVRERGTVQHLGSMVTGALSPGADCWDALEALFPAVTASGIPKVAALRSISALEVDERGLYSGCACVVDGGGELDSALILRSIFQDATGSTWLRAGAGIVEGSCAAAEFDETTNKLRSTARALVGAGD
ncbi:salicylate synthetase [Nocardia tenerifensis]|uniref:Salicylate synthetase n=1 Tax=Nocardia tenerifensis TaxID=228006 RepID=A0A318KCK5_9NOCA|nr:salicylate synthase [Nocardia tenerifensis]PXX71557.1 salicylate synthetase [Nocardia tenerifensis]